MVESESWQQDDAVEHIQDLSRVCYRLAESQEVTQNERVKDHVLSTLISLDLQVEIGLLSLVSRHEGVEEDVRVLNICRQVLHQLRLQVLIAAAPGLVRGVFVAQHADSTHFVTVLLHRGVVTDQVLEHVHHLEQI